MTLLHRKSKNKRDALIGSSLLNNSILCDTNRSATSDFGLRSSYEGWLMHTAYVPMQY